MCYSAQIWADYRKYTKIFGAVISIREFVDTFWHRRHEVASIKLPKALEAAFEAAPADSDELRQIQQAIAEYKTERAARLEQELFKQVKRRADAQRVLDSGKVTKKAQRICASRRPRSGSSRPGCRTGAGWSSPTRTLASSRATMRR